MFLNSDPKGATYNSLIDIAFDVCDEFILVVRNDPGLYLSKNGENVLELLKTSLKEFKDESKWASGQLFARTAGVYHYNTDQNAREIIKKVSNSLHSWVQPNLPEDLSFIQNGCPWLINSSHEHSSLIKTKDESEISRILTIEGLDVSSD